MFIQNMIIEEGLTHFYHVKCISINRSEFVLIRFYRQLINSSHADSSYWQTKSLVSFPLGDKHVVNEHRIIRKSPDATKRKIPLCGAFECIMRMV